MTHLFAWLLDWYVLCEVYGETEERFQHVTHNTKHNQLASLRIKKREMKYPWSSE